MCRAFSFFRYVGVTGFEPVTSCSQSRRDDRTTLHPGTLLAVRGGFEPPVRKPVRQFSKLLVSATHPSHRINLKCPPQGGVRACSCVLRVCKYRRIFPFGKTKCSKNPLFVPLFLKKYPFAVPALRRRKTQGRLRASKKGGANGSALFACTLTDGYILE